MTYFSDDRMRLPLRLQQHVGAFRTALQLNYMSDIIEPYVGPNNFNFSFYQKQNSHVEDGEIT